MENRHGSILRMAAPLLLAFMFLLPNLSVVSTNTPAAQGGCAATVIPRVRALESTIDKWWARQLAEQSAQFANIVAGHAYSFEGVSDEAKFDPNTCGNVHLNVISVNYVLEDVIISTHDGLQTPAGFQIFEDAGLVNVTGAAVSNRSVFPGGASYQSGYRANGAGSPNLIASQTDWTQPAISYTAPCNDPNHSPPWVCAVAIWTGLWNGGIFLAQIGVNAYMFCASTPPYTCQTPPGYQGIWEFFPRPPGTCTNTVNVGDSMQALSENGLDWLGGNGSSWEVFLTDNPGGWTCNSGVQVYTQTTTYALSIFERPNTTGCGVPNCFEHLPKFNSGNTVSVTSNQSCYGSVSGGITCKWFDQGTLATYYMSNDGLNRDCASPAPLGTNICLSSMSSGSYTQKWYTSAGT